MDRSGSALSLTQPCLRPDCRRSHQGAGCCACCSLWPPLFVPLCPPSSWPLPCVPPADAAAKAQVAAFIIECLDKFYNKKLIDREEYK